MEQIQKQAQNIVQNYQEEDEIIKGLMEWEFQEFLEKL